MVYRLASLTEYSYVVHFLCPLFCPKVRALNRCLKILLLKESGHIVDVRLGSLGSVSSIFVYIALCVRRF